MSEPLADELRILMDVPLDDLAMQELGRRDVTVLGIPVTRLVAEVRRLRSILDAVTLGLRIASEEIGDPSWPDDLHPADVLSKYVLRPASYEIERLRSDEWLERAGEEITKEIAGERWLDGEWAPVVAILRKHRDGKA